MVSLPVASCAERTVRRAAPRPARDATGRRPEEPVVALQPASSSGPLLAAAAKARPPLHADDEPNVAVAATIRWCVEPLELSSCSIAAAEVWDAAGGPVRPSPAHRQAELQAPRMPANADPAVVV